MSTGPMRIIHCVRSPIGGILRHIKDLALAQAAAGHKVGLICDSSTGSEFDQAVLDALAPKLELGLARFAMKRQLTIQDLTSTFELYQHIRDLKPDVLHGHGAKGGAYARTIGTILRLKGQHVTRIYCPHGGSLHYDPNRIEGRIYHTIERQLSRITDGFVFVSDYEYGAFESKVGDPKAPSRVVYNGLQKEEFSPVGAAPDARDFLYIGMLRDLKGPDLFIEALYNIKLNTGTPPSAFIAGEGPDHDRYQEMIHKFGLSDTVHMIGAQRAREAFKMAHCVVVPSRAEAMPYIILEAVAAQKPLIATRVGGVPEIFGKFSSRLIEPGHIGKLTTAMEFAQINPDEMAEQARELRKCLAETFSVELMSDRITTLYKELRGIPTATEVVGDAPATLPAAEFAQQAFAKTSQKQ